MYTFLIKQDDTWSVTNKENIYHRTSLVRNLRFLVDPLYISGNETLDMRNYVCTLEYRTPISHRYVPVMLTPSANLYKDKLEYVLAIDTKITAEVGKVEMKLNFMRLELGEDGSFKERVRVIDGMSLDVLHTTQWSDYIASSDLTPLAEVIFTNQAQIEEAKLLMQQVGQLTIDLAQLKADGIKYNEETNELRLTALGEEIGNRVYLEDCNIEAGVPVVDINALEPNPDIPGTPDGEIDNVVEIDPKKAMINETNNVVEI